jgi:hypothetical protein
VREKEKDSFKCLHYYEIGEIRSGSTIISNLTPPFSAGECIPSRLLGEASGFRGLIQFIGVGSVLSPSEKPAMNLDLFLLPKHWVV